MMMNHGASRPRSPGFEGLSIAYERTLVREENWHDRNRDPSKVDEDFVVDEWTINDHNQF